LKEARLGAGEIGRFVADVPALLGQAEKALQSMAEMASTGVRLDQPTIERLAEAEARQARSGRLALWIGALALAALAAVAVTGALWR
jgi:ubiquinone biosynthesis protein